MNIVNAYQTLEDQDNIDYVEKEGPFKCTRSDAWLGHGYYFWDTNIDWAKSWGERSYVNRGKEYIIGHSKIDISNRCFDLKGNTQHEMDLLESFKILKESKLTPKNIDPTVPEIIEFMKKHNIFDFLSIRAADKHYKTIEVKFNNKNKEVQLLNQRVQICVLYKKEVLLRPFKIIYPDKYLE